MLRASWLQGFSRRLLSLRNVKLGGRKARRTAVRLRSMGVEQLETRVVLSVTNSSFAMPPVPPAVPSLELVSISYTDGIYRAPHGRPFTGSMPEFGRNDVLDQATTWSGQLPATAPATPGTTTIQYQLTDGTGASWSEDVTLLSTNRKPVTRNRYVAIRPDPATTITTMPTPAPCPLGGMSISGTDLSIGEAGSDPDGDPTTVVVVTPPTLGSLSWYPVSSVTGTSPSWGWNYNAASGSLGVDTFVFSVADDVPESSTAKVHVAITIHHVKHWLLIEAHADVNYWGDRWDAPVTGNVLN